MLEVCAVFCAGGDKGQTVAHVPGGNEAADGESVWCCVLHVVRAGAVGDVCPRLLAGSHTATTMSHNAGLAGDPIGARRVCCKECVAALGCVLCRGGRALLGRVRGGWR